MKPEVDYHLERVSYADIAPLLEAHHPYKAGKPQLGTYVFGVLEKGRTIAGYLWAPPPYGAAKSVRPDAPLGVLALSRMVAVPKAERSLNHVSRPLRYQMKHLIDRTRWPSLVTWHDEGEGHTGHVYKCSGWTKTRSSRSPKLRDASGARVSGYCNGRHVQPPPSVVRTRSTLWRWEHHAVPSEVNAEQWMLEQGWERRPIPGKTWRSGKPAHRVTRRMV